MTDIELIDVIYRAALKGDWQSIASAVQERVGHGQQARATLCSTLDLTPAEAELALALRKGLTLKEHAAQRHVSLHTVRNQLKLIFEKTGTHRQAQLVAMLAGIIG